MLDAIRAKVGAAERITGEEGLFLLRDASLLDLAPWPNWCVTGTTRSRWSPSL